MAPTALERPHLSLASYAALKKAVADTLVQGQAQIEQLKVRVYWQTGTLIDQYLNQHPQGTTHGQQLMVRLAKDFQMEVTLFYRMLKFAQSFPNLATSQELTWSHYRELLTVPSPKKRLILARLATQHHWPVRRLRHELAKSQGAASASNKGHTPSGQLQEPDRPTREVRRVAWLAALDGKTQKVVDLGFNNYLALTSAQAKRWDTGTVITWQPATQQWQKGGALDDIYGYRGQVERVVDGDTLLVHIHLGLNIKRRQYLRVRGANVAERHTPVGDKARLAVQRLLKKETHPTYQIDFKSRSRDLYDRYIADIWLGGVYLNQWLLDQGLATPA